MDIIPNSSLHSTMYLFLPDSVCNGISIRNCLYIPQCIYFYHKFTASSSTHSILYIPQCIYFYTLPECKSSFILSCFTFHNVSISTIFCILAVGLTLMLYIPQCIYFYLVEHCNDNQLFCLYIPQCIYFYNDTDRIIARLDATLHSTMYLFLLNPHKRVSLVCYSLHSTMYLFLRFSDIVIPAYALLYIPQCIYFYFFSLKVCIISGGSLHSTMYLFLRVCGTFYFTGGFTLHSTMYLFLRASQQEQIRYLSTFTFHNVSISTRDCLSRMVFRLSTLHSTMYLFLQR